VAIGLSATYRFFTVTVWSTAFTVAVSLAALHARWHTRSTRWLLVIGCAVILILCGLWQYSQSDQSQTFNLDERPRLSVPLPQLRKPKVGEKAQVAVPLHNRGEVLARSVRLAGRVVIRENYRPDSCAPVVRMNSQEPLVLTGQTLPSRTTEWAVLRSDGVLSEDAIKQIVSGKAAVIVYVFTEYGRDGKTTPYYYEYHAYFDYRVMQFVSCPNHNGGN